MKPEQLIAEVEALQPSGPDQVVTKFYKWRLLGPLVLDALKSMQAATERLTAESARLTTPRPIEEAPKDGTWVLVYWDATAFRDEELPGVNRWDIGRCVAGLWEGEEGDEFVGPTHFLPLPVKP